MAGSSPLSYQWELNGTNFATTTAGLLVFTNAQPANDGTYEVTITNAAGTVASASATLTVVDAGPIVVAGPTNQTSLAGNDAAFSVSTAGSLPMSYQWQFNGTNIESATNAALSLANLTIANEGTYDVVVSNAFGFSASTNAYLNVVDLAEALNDTNLVWSTGGSAVWYVENANTHDGFAAARSGIIASSQQSTLQTTVTGPGTLSFWWEVSSEPAIDYLNFSINGVEQARISGSPVWQQQTVYVGAGVQSLQWAYNQTDAVNFGQDAGSLDQIGSAPGGAAPLITLNPTNQNILVGSSATLNAAALGTPPLSYQWQLDGTNLAGSINPSLTLSNVQYSNQGFYTWWSAMDTV